MNKYETLRQGIYNYKNNYKLIERRKKKEGKKYTRWSWWRTYSKKRGRGKKEEKKKVSAKIKNFHVIFLIVLDDRTRRYDRL